MDNKSHDMFRSDNKRFDNDIIYIGPSWAVQSYSTPMGDDGDGSEINIGDLFAEEFNHSFGKKRHAWLPSHGISNSSCVDRCISSGNVQRHIQKKPILWVLCDPLARLYYDKTKRTMTWPYYKEDEIVVKAVKVESWVDRFFKNPNWLKQRNELLHVELKLMNDLGVPIGILGAHSDITYEDVIPYENLTVIEQSWQKILCNHANIEPMPTNLGADFLHQTLKIYIKQADIENHLRVNNLDKYVWRSGEATKQLMTLIMNPTTIWKGSRSNEDSIEPSIIDYIHEQYDVWRQLEDKGLFNWVHPSIEGNLIFYEHVKNNMERFINAHKE